MHCHVAVVIDPHREIAKQPTMGIEEGRLRGLAQHGQVGIGSRHTPYIGEERTRARSTLRDATVPCARRRRFRHATSCRQAGSARFLLPWARNKIHESPPTIHTSQQVSVPRSSLPRYPFGLVPLPASSSPIPSLWCDFSQEHENTRRLVLDVDRRCRLRTSTRTDT